VTKFGFGWDFDPDPSGKTYSAFQTFWLDFRGSYF